MKKFPTLHKAVVNHNILYYAYTKVDQLHNYAIPGFVHLIVRII